MARVLVVDDEYNIARLVRTALVRAGHDVVVASSAESAMQLCRDQDQPFDLVLSDVQMPGIGGRVLARWVVEHHPRTRVALMSGSDPGLGIRTDTSLPQPALPQLAKPFKNLAEVVAFVAGVLELKP